MDSLEGLSLRELWRAVRLAVRLHTREHERSAERRVREELLRAVSEVGVTDDQLRRAAAQVRRQRPGRRILVTALVAGALAPCLAAGMWVSRRAETMATATVIAPAPAGIAPLVSSSEDVGAPASVNPSDYRTTSSGLMIAVLQAGSGAPTQVGQPVVLHYTGWLWDTREKFDSSRDRGEPFEFTLGAGQCIPGWEEAILGMRVGERRQLVIPSDLAYGEHGAPGAIPPKATLIFDVELLDIRAQPPVTP